MRIPRSLRAVTAALLLAAAGGAPAAEPAPPFTLTDARGESVSLSDFRGRYVVLEWTNHQCPFVRKHYESGNMQSQQAFARERGIAWLSIISSAPGTQGHVSGARAIRVAEQSGASPRHILLDPDGEVGRAYGARTTPHMYIIDPDGKLIYQGGIDSIPSADPADIPRATQYVQVAMTQVLDGQPVATRSSRPYGCSVKYD